MLGEVERIAERSAVRMQELLPSYARVPLHELTPVTLVVLGQLLAVHLAIARGMDPDRPRTIQKVTRTW